MTDFLLACIAEDEAVASDGTELTYPGFESWKLHNQVRHAFGQPSPVIASRARVLAECKAKRRIVELLGGTVPHYADPLRAWESCPRVRPAEYCEGTDLAFGPDAPCECGADEQNARGGPPILRELTAVYADRPGYRQEWTP